MDANPAAQAATEAALALQRAEAEAAALLAELNAKDNANAVASTVHKMPSPYAPGEEPPRDPVKSLAALYSQGQDWANDQSFRPAFGETTLPVSHTVDFAQKIKDAQKPRGNH
jgi:hypothetical protein